MTPGARCSILVLAFWATSPPARGQRIPTTPLDSGLLIRITSTGGATVRGRLLEPFRPSASSVLVFCAYPRSPCASRVDPNVQSMPVTQVATLDRAAGSHWLTGGVIGAGIGGVMGGLFIHLANGLCDTSRCRSSGPPVAMGLTLFGFGLGALFGASSPRWERVP